MGFFGDLGKALLGAATGDNDYANQVSSRYNLLDEREIINAIDECVNAAASGNLSKSTGYRKGILDYITNRLRELDKKGDDGGVRFYKVKINIAVSHCEKNSWISDIYRNIGSSLQNILDR
ncbi:MAG: hypothetical protein K2N06_12015 [Oscillospiraceae bacterium]|nr:hypothetical protein [Oscillospiraceae bacterium]